jgi:hypothetical protein
VQRLQQRLDLKLFLLQLQRQGLEVEQPAFGVGVTAITRGLEFPRERRDGLADQLRLLLKLLELAIDVSTSMALCLLHGSSDAAMSAVAGLRDAIDDTAPRCTTLKRGVPVQPTPYLPGIR